MQLSKTHINSYVVASLSMIIGPKHNDPFCTIRLNKMLHPLSTKTKSE